MWDWPPGRRPEPDTSCSLAKPAPLLGLVVGLAIVVVLGPHLGRLPIARTAAVRATPSCDHATPSQGGEPSGAERPTGTVTFLFTDVEGSTRLWLADEPGMAASLVLHDRIVRTAIESAGGYVLSTGGDGFAAAFGGRPMR